MTKKKKSRKRFRRRKGGVEEERFLEKRSKKWRDGFELEEKKLFQQYDIESLCAESEKVKLE